MTKLIAPLCSSTLLLCSNYEKTIAICCLKGLFVMKNDEKDYEIISGLEEGYYKLKSNDYFINSSDIPAGNLILSEEFILFWKNLIISNPSFIYDGKLKTSITSPKIREKFFSKLTVLVNRKL